MKKVGVLILTLVFAASQAWAATAKADLKSTVTDSLLAGTASFEDTAEGLSVNVTVENAPPGMHGFHIHEKGSCEDAGNAAGGHYNPAGVAHGFLPHDGFEKAHAGDFGNIEVGPDGQGALKMLLPGLTLQGGQYDVAGHAVILHEKKDDFGQPTGNAGARIACGIIEA